MAHKYSQIEGGSDWPHRTRLSMAGVVVVGGGDNGTRILITFIGEMLRLNGDSNLLTRNSSPQ